jgi:uncharacterized protein YdhG (YjbR/CyaY superfamily)
MHVVEKTQGARTSAGTARDFDAYAARFPKKTQQLLRQMRQTIRKAAPQATETISYRMPAVRLNGILVWYAAHTKHIGFYPGASGIAAFEKELSVYKSAKGSVQFPLDEPLPLSLVTRIVAYRVREQQAKRPHTS